MARDFPRYLFLLFLPLRIFIATRRIYPSVLKSERDTRQK